MERSKTCDNYSLKQFDDFYSVDCPHFSATPSGWLGEFANKLSGRKLKRALDLGCGHGRYSFYLAKQGFEVTAVDNSGVATDFLKSQSAVHGLPIRVICEDMQRVEIPPESFDLIAVITSMGDIPVPGIRQLIGKIAHGLRQGGLVAVEEFSPNDPGATGKTGASELSHLVTNYFSTDDMAMLFSGLQQIFCRELEVFDGTHGSPHCHSLVRYVGRRPQ